MAVEEDSEAQERQGNGETETLNPLGTGQDAPNNPGQDAPNNPPSQDDAVDGEVQARFMERALAESLRLRREAVRFNERRDEGRNAIEGGAARMAELLEEHNAENFASPPFASNPTSAEKQ